MNQNPETSCKFFLYIVFIAIILISPSCKKEKDDNGNGGSDPSPVNKEYFIDFSDGTADGWFSVDGTWIVSNNVYKVTSNQTLFANTCYFDSALSNYELEVRVRKTQGEPCNVGISFNGDPSSVGPLGNWNNTYKLIICTHNGWSIGKIKDTVFTEFEVGNSPDIIKGLSQWNIISVKVFNGQIDVFFNGVLQGSYQDNTFLSGKIGLSMFDQLYGGVAEFDYVKIREITTVKEMATKILYKPRKVYGNGMYQGDCTDCDIPDPVSVL